MRPSPAVPAVALLAAAVLTGCGAAVTPGSEGAGGGSAGGLEVVATTTQLQDFVRVVGGDRVELHGVLRPGLAAHDVSPTPADLVAIGQADVLVENGLGLEHWLDDTVTASGFDGVRVDASEGVEVREPAGAREEHGHAEEAHAEEAHAGETHAEDAHAEDAHPEEVTHTSGDGHDHSGADPHIWHSPLNAVVMVGNVADGLAEADPANAEIYRANAEAYAEELRALDAEVEAAIAALPEKRVVTNHDAFGYYLDRYGLEFVGSIIPSSDSSAELSGADVAALAQRIRETGATAVFSENSLPPETAETVGREAGVTVVAGQDALYGDSLGEPGSGAETYVDMIRHNTRVFVEALGG